MEQLYLGAPGFAGIYRETYRVLLRDILPVKGGRGTAILSALVLPHIAANCAFLFLLDGSDPVPDAVTITYSLCTAFLVPLICTAAFVFRAGSPYRTDGDSGACDLILRNNPRAPLKRLSAMFNHVAPLFIAYCLFTIATLLVLLLQDPSVMLPLQVIGGAACLAGATYASLVLHIMCVVSVLERDNPISELCRSRALLAGKFWAVAAVFVPLDGCFGALMVSLLLLTTERARGLGRGFQVAAGAVMAVALWAVVVVTLAAQPVVYLVCKNHHCEVVDIDVELQAVAEP